MAGPGGETWNPATDVLFVGEVFGGKGAGKFGFFVKKDEEVHEETHEAELNEKAATLKEECFAGDDGEDANIHGVAQ